VDGIEICEVNEIKERLKKTKKTYIKNSVDIEKIVSLMKGNDV